MTDARKREADDARKRQETAEDVRKRTLAESQAKVERRNAAVQQSTGEAKPTPTQEENDRAALGEHIIEKEPDGSVPMPPVVDPPPEGDTQATAQRRRLMSPAAGSAAITRRAAAVRVLPAPATRQTNREWTRARSFGALPARLPPWSLARPRGSTRPGPYHLPVTGGWLSADAAQYWNWWQMGYDPSGGSSRSAMVEACVSAYAQTIAMCPGDHWRTERQEGPRPHHHIGAVAHPALSERLPVDFRFHAESRRARSTWTATPMRLACATIATRSTELHLMDPRQSAAAGRA